MNDIQVKGRTREVQASSFRAVLTGALVCLCIVVLSGCVTTTAGGAVGANRSQLMLISSEELNQLAAQSYDKLRSDAAAKGVLNQDAAMLKRVRTITARLQAQTNVFRKDAPGWQWEVNIMTSDELNAFCMPGGKVMVYSGLITKLKLTDAELANVLGHEIAHALREHVREQMSQALVAQGVIGAGAAIFGLGKTSTDAANVGYQVLLATKFSRTDESEADQIGLELAARAGIRPTCRHHIVAENDECESRRQATGVSQLSSRGCYSRTADSETFTQSHSSIRRREVIDRDTT